ncbi:hypothetical protein B8W69_09620 [Mycobacterium vulneris]|jgi:hypothetical protein|uniref:Uncharacterized protein n=1 Tax=Mycolicibacterium vulneris TaxID=547163 RepID=A0A1X2L5G3_9MYCO|nr:hypothetical protein [Mycolicibacterium vulneris]OSC29249.1 hypothetical protein B8W69_09620 [Mycolicibacterium vulneris]
MTTNTPRPTIAGGCRRRLLRLTLAGAATLAVLALYDAAQPQTPGTTLGPGSVRLTDMAFPQAPPGLTGGSLAADDGDDQAQLQQQLNQQQLQQSMQQAEEQNEQAQQQFNQDMQQQQTYENQFNNP